LLANDSFDRVVSIVAFLGLSPSAQPAHISKKDIDSHRSRLDVVIGAFEWVRVSWNMFNSEVP
jgi:hypothetical protein